VKTIADGIATFHSRGVFSHTISAPRRLPMKKVMISEISISPMVQGIA
jgi:hypothetical protein